MQLDRLGLVLLQKAAASTRPSRWIDPALMDSALAHLEVVGSGGTTLPQMLERRAALEANGVVREGGGFVREVQKPLSVPVPEGRPWSITVAFRVPVDAELAWAFHRSGNLEKRCAPNSVRRRRTRRPRTCALTWPRWWRAATPTSRAGSSCCCRACRPSAPRRCRCRR